MAEFVGVNSTTAGLENAKHDLVVALPRDSIGVGAKPPISRNVSVRDEVL